jgi:hypothetical protein
MRRFVLEVAERELCAELVSGVRDGMEVPYSRLVLTDRRIALVVPRPAAFGRWAGRVLGPILGPTARALVSGLELTHEIRREDFDLVEHAGPMVVFRSKGTGYAETRFEVLPRSPAAITADRWRARLAAWVAGDLAAAATDRIEAFPEAVIPEARARTSSRRPRS